MFTQREDRHQYSTSTVVPGLEVKKEVKQDNVERTQNTKTGREIRETIQMSYIQLSAARRKTHILKTVIKIRGNHTGRGWRS